MSKSGRGDRGVAASALPVPLDLTRGRQREHVGKRNSWLSRVFSFFSFLLLLLASADICELM